MRRLGFGALMIALLFASGCGRECKVTSQCDRGQYCDFTTGDCIQGCTSNSDCPVSGVCMLDTGQCKINDPGPQMPRDIGTTTTSTVPGADASLGD